MDLIRCVWLATSDEENKAQENQITEWLEMTKNKNDVGLQVYLMYDR